MKYHVVCVIFLKIWDASHLVFILDSQHREDTSYNILTINMIQDYLTKQAFILLDWAVTLMHLTWFYHASLGLKHRMTVAPQASHPRDTQVWYATEFSY